MAEKKYYWLKLKNDFFSSKRIKKLRKLAGGDTYTIIYLKMQLLSLKSNGVLTYTGLEKTFAEELALDLDEDVENVAVTLAYLSSHGLVESSDNISFFLPYAIENTGYEGGSAQRVREYRERAKALHCNSDVTKCNTTTVTCNTEIEIEKEKDIEIEIEEPVLTLSLKDGTDYPIYAKDISEWQSAYPLIDVHGELLQMKSWCNANPQKRKTESGIKRFINGWLSKEKPQQTTMNPFLQMLIEEDNEYKRND